MNLVKKFLHRFVPIKIFWQIVLNKFDFVYF